MSTPIPMVDLRAQYLRIKNDIDAAMARVVDTTAFIKGPDCGAFEKEFAAFCGAEACVGVANGTDALIYALRAYGVGRGDEVVTVANTFIATGEAIFLNGATPVFVDVDDVTYTLDPNKLEAAITKKTKVIIPVHLYGHPCAMEAINQIAAAHGIPVLEDSAQGHAATSERKARGHARSCRLLQLLSGQEPRSLRRRGCGGLERQGIHRQGTPDRESRRGDATSTTT